MTWLPIAQWAPEWKQRGVVRADFMAGLTGAIVALPQGLAFATLAGMPPHYGLYAAIVPCIIAALFGSSRTMVTGPANAISLTTMALIAPLALPESEHYIGLVLTLSLLVGLVQIALGVGGVGKWVEKVPHSVIVGFTFGAAILIINSQVGTLLGVGIARGTSVIDTVQAVWRYGQAGQIQIWPIVLVAATLIGLRLWRPLNRIVPAMLVAVIVGSLIAVLIERFIGNGFEFRRVGAIPAAIPPLSIPALNLEVVQQLFGAVLVMVLLASTEAMAIARAMALKSKDRFNANQEFIGQGLANVGGAFFSSFPASGSFNRSGVNFSAGARTPLAAASAGLFLMVILLFVSPLAMHLPYVVIAALLLAVAWGLIDRRQIRHEWDSGPREWVPMLLTALGTIFISLEWAILLGICAALVAQRLLPVRR
jgi:sulfate permease, SulP family